MREYELTAQQEGRMFAKGPPAGTSPKQDALSLLPTGTVCLQTCAAGIIGYAVTLPDHRRIASAGSAAKAWGKAHDWALRNLCFEEGETVVPSGRRLGTLNHHAYGTTAAMEQWEADGTVLTVVARYRHDDGRWLLECSDASGTIENYHPEELTRASV